MSRHCMDGVTGSRTILPKRSRGWRSAAVLLVAAAFSVAAADPPAPDTIPGVARVDAEGLLALVNERPDLVIIDARIGMDRRQGYIEGSASLPDVDTNCRSLGRLVRDKATPVLFYCNGPKCGRSVTAARIALGCGYRSVYWFRGGFEEWQSKNYPYLKQQ